jgi:predicted PurR-regulated permease PerM
VSSVEDSEAVRWADRRFDVLERAGGELKQHVGTIASSVVAAATGAISLLAGLVTVLALTAFLLTSFPALWRQALRWVRPERRPRLERRGREVRAAVAGYAAGALVMGAIAGVVTGVTTALLGVPYALALAALTALLGIVPFVGAVVSGAIVVLVTFLALGWKSGLVALAVFVAYQQLEGAVLQPLVQRRTVALNPLVVIVAALLGTAAGGVFGGVMALPLAAAGQVIVGDALRERERARDGEGEGARARERGAR